MSYGGYGGGQHDPFADAGPGYGGQGYGEQGYSQQWGAQGPHGHAPGPQGSYGAYGQQVTPGFAGPQDDLDNDRRLFGLLAIGLGLVGFVLAWIAAVYILAAVLAAIGIIFAGASLAKEPNAKGFAITGLIAGCAGLAVATVQLIISLLS